MDAIWRFCRAAERITHSLIINVLQSEEILENVKRTLIVPLSALLLFYSVGAMASCNYIPPIMFNVF